MKALKVLIPSLLVAGVMAVPLEASGAEETKASKGSHATFRGTAITARSFRDTKYTKLPTRENTFKWGTRWDTVKQPQLGAALHGDLGNVRDVPELSASGAGASLALVAAGLLALTGRRKRKQAESA
jgi:MYXO-CTERM domain-containing protein